MPAPQGDEFYTQHSGIKHYLAQVTVKQWCFDACSSSCAFCISACDSQTFQFMSESRSHVAPSSDSTKRVMLQIWQPRLFSEQRMTVCNNAALHYPPQGPLLEKCAANLFNFQFHPDYLQTEIGLNSKSLCIFL